MKVFSELVFDAFVRGTTEVYSAPQFNETLGKADDIVLEVEVEEAAGSSPTVTVAHYHSISGKGFAASSGTALFNLIDISAPPYRDVKTQSGPLGGLGRIGVKLGASSGTPTARVRVWAVGRSK